jgi:sugar PTS system EIIA component
VFSGEMVGPGVAVDPPAGPVEAVSPVDGRLVKLHPHAFVVLTAEGAGVLVHLGIDTVQLDGRGFELLAAEGDDVRAGQPIVRWDAAAVAAGGRSAVCPVVVLDTSPDMVRDKRTDGDVTIGDVLFTWHR